MNDNIKGIVVSGAKFHSLYTASGLEKYNMLEKYIISEKNINQITKMISKKSVKYIKTPFWIGAILRKIPYYGKRIPYNILSDVLFDIISFLTIIRMKDIKYFLGFNNYSLIQMKYLKKNGVKLLLDQRIAHVNKEIDIYIGETNKLPNNLSRHMIKRKLMEYELADYILVGSQFVKDTFIENGIDEKKLKVVNYGYDNSVFKSYKNKNNDDTLRIIFVGQIGYRKGVKYILEAIYNLKKSGLNIELTLVGNIDDDFKYIIKKYEEIINYKGFMKVQELVDEYNKNDLFIFPSLCEGSARVTYEAAACGLPLLVTHSSGSIVEDMITGIVIQEKSTDSIEKAISLLYSDRNLLEYMKQNILKEIKKYTWENYEKNIADFIKEII